MFKSKAMFGLAALVMLLALAQSGFAQVGVTVTGNPAPRETNTNRMAETNDPVNGGSLIITGVAQSNAFVTIGRIRIDYPAPITSDSAAIVSGCGTCSDFPAGDPIQIESSSGFFATATIHTIDYVEGRIEINIDNFTPAGNGDTGTVILSGVRIDANGLTAPVNADISLVSAPNVNIFLNTTSVPVINALADGVGSLAQTRIPTSVTTVPAGGVTDFGVGTIFTNRSTPDSFSTFTVTEGHRSAWFRNDPTNLVGAPAAWQNDASFKLTFNGIPAGVTLTLNIDSYTSGTPTLSRSVITTANNTSTIDFTTNVSTSSTTLDQIQFSLTVTNVSSSASLTAGTITVQASMTPVGAALTDTNPPLPDKSASPRFAEKLTAAVPIISIVEANTTLLMPFAVRSGAFDTGIALSNTSADPLGGTSFGGLTAQSGKVRLDFFPRTSTGAGTSFSLTTSSSVKPGIGLSADGTLAAGATWTALLSELLTAAGQSGDFTGYIFIRADFLGGHGAPFVSDFRGFTSFAPMLVLPPPSIFVRAGAAFESLGM